MVQRTNPFIIWTENPEISVRRRHGRVRVLIDLQPTSVLANEARGTLLNSKFMQVRLRVKQQFRTKISQIDQLFPLVSTFIVVTSFWAFKNIGVKTNLVFCQRTCSRHTVIIVKERVIQISRDSFYWPPRGKNLSFLTLRMWWCYKCDIRWIYFEMKVKVQNHTVLTD